MEKGTEKEKEMQPHLRDARKVQPGRRRWMIREARRNEDDVCVRNQDRAKVEVSPCHCRAQTPSGLSLAVSLAVAAVVVERFARPCDQGMLSGVHGRTG
jgi:hypothetical protein